MKTLKPLLALALGLSTASACYEADSKTESTQSELTSSKTSEAPAEGDLAATMPTATPAELEQLVATIQPLKARNGDLRFTDARLRTPAAAPLLIERLRGARDGHAIRHALILALPRTQGTYAADALELQKLEQDETLRAALVDAMRLAKDAEPAIAALKLGLSDSSALVRSRAAFNLGRRADGILALDALVAAISDREVAVQSEAARALGLLGASQAFEAVVPLLQSPSADARLEAVRALARMDAAQASKLPELAALASDSDERIRTAVGKAKSQQY